tara:strand:- start:913 stop:1620 length:708 start_codon:yes stop_codon:yes gene_type:complete
MVQSPKLEAAIDKLKQRGTLGLSKASKMPCQSWSLEAFNTCAGAMDNEGNEVDACKGCYARGGNYRFPNVAAVRIFNKQDWKRDEWVADMVTALDNDRYFRWFDSGDMYSLGLAFKMLEVMQRTPWCKHWLPTRQHKFDKFQAVIAQMEALPNVVVRLSSDSVIGETIAGATSSVIIPDTSHAVDSNTEVCDAYDRSGKCGDCRRCWSKDVQVIAYPAHGKKAVKLSADIIARAA